MRRFGLILLLVLLLSAPIKAFAATAEDVASAVNQWGAAFNANDVDALVKLYAPDAVLIGPAGSTVVEGKDAIRKYYSRLEKSGDKVEMDVRKVIVLDDNVAYVAGFDQFTALRNGETATSSNGFTMVLVKRGNDWLIAHQHSSRR
jgi:uncharacterized protein (TIGR02246 family)